MFAQQAGGEKADDVAHPCSALVPALGRPITKTVGFASVSFDAMPSPYSALRALVEGCVLHVAQVRHEDLLQARVYPVPPKCSVTLVKPVVPRDNPK